MKTCRRIVIFFALIFSALVFSCSSTKEESRYTRHSVKSGSKSKVPVSYSVHEPSGRPNPDGTPEVLSVMFDGSVAGLDEVDREPSAPILILPEIAGKWQWSSDSVLTFTPKSAWALDGKYKVSMPESIFSKNVSVKNSFTFKTEAFSTSLRSPEFYINPQNPQEKRVTAAIRSSHPMEMESVRKCVSMDFVYLDSRGRKIRSESVPFEVSMSKDFSEAYIVSDSLPIPPYTSSVVVSMKKGIEAKVGGKSGYESSEGVSIPGMSDFVRIEGISASLVKNSSNNYDQMLVLETKGSVSVEEIHEKISVYELPKDRPEMEGWNAVENYAWSAEFCTDEILGMSKKISLDPVPTPEPASSINSFRFNATAGRYLYVKIDGDLNFFGGYRLHFDNSQNVYSRCVPVPKYPRELSIMSEGTILSLSGSRRLAIYSRGVDTAYFRLSRIMPKDVNHLVSMSNGNMRNFNFNTYNFSENNIAESEVSSFKIAGASDRYVSYFSYDLGEKMSSNPGKNLANGLFIFQVTDTESRLGRQENYYYGRQQSLSDRRLILVTDIGFIVKKNSDGTRNVFVQSISGGSPIADASVRIIGLNGNAILTARTDGGGRAWFPAISGYTGEHTPTAFVVETSNDLSFMPYSENGRVLDYSNFDVGGEYGNSDPAKISAYMFSDRGMYRPGEEVHLAMIAKANDWNIDLRGTPLEAEVVDSNGSVIYTRRLQLSSSGFEEISFKTQDYSPTGNYSANLYFIKEYKDRTERNFLASENVKIEEYLPDSLSITTGFDPLPGKGWINPGELKGTVHLKNLFGTPAAGHAVKANLLLTPGFPMLYRYSDYKFSDPFKEGSSHEVFLGNTVADDNGEVSFELDLAKFERATYRLSFFAEGFEKAGGRSVSSQSSVYVSPLRHLVGYKADGKLDYINANSKRKLSFIAIDQNLEQISLSDVTLSIEEVRYVSTLVKQHNGLYKYQSVKKTYPVESRKIEISRNGTEFFVPSQNPGEYRITLSDSEGLVFNSISYTIVGDRNVSRSLTRTAELDIKLESADLNPGSVAKVFIKAPYEGYGLITVERDRLYTYKWFKTSELSTVQTIQIPEDIEGNGYINVMYARSASSEEIFMSPFCYGAVPFSVGREKRTNSINLEFPSEIKSGTDLKINYSSSDSGKIVIFAIDEGILQVAKYRTPDPLAFFFKKRALEVRTSQILDLVLPEFNILRTLSATGGGAAMERLAKNLNPFKRRQNDSVAFWSGVVETGPEKRSVTYRVPDYFNGTIRVMAVAVSKDRIGVEQKSTLAANDLIIMPNVPLAAAPGDEFDVSVSVTNNHKGTGENSVLLRAEGSRHLEIIGEKSVKLKIAEGRDAAAKFRVRAKDVLGAAEIKFTASDETESSVISSTMSVRPSMPYQVWIHAGLSKKPQAEIDVDHRLYDEMAKRNVSVSNVPTTFRSGLKTFLEEYPYGCSEQVTSKAYPYLYKDFVKAAGKTQSDAEKMVSDTISILQSRQKSDGNIGYWTGKSENDDFITLYCAEFLTDAKNRGFYVPSSMYAKTLDAVRSIASRRDDSSYGIYIRAFAIYVLTKSDVVTTSYLESLEGELTRKNFTASDYEGLYLAASYAMLKQDRKANEILQKVKNRKTFDSSWIYHNGLHYIATYIDIVASYFPSRIGDIKAREVEELCSHLEYRYYSTYSTSAAIRAFESYAYTDKSEVYKIYEIAEKNQTEIQLNGDSVLAGEFSPSAKKIRYVSDRSMPLYYGAVQAGFERDIPKKQISDGLEVSRQILSEDGSPLKSLKIGDTVQIRVSFRSLGGVMRNIALIDMTPAGLETDIRSIRGQTSLPWSPDYVDIREDRVVVYGTVTDKVNTFTYRAKAVSSGRFTVPPMFAESMYNKEIRAITPYEPIEILPMDGPSK